MNRFAQEDVNRVFQELNYHVLEQAGDIVIYQDDSPQLYAPRFAMVLFDNGGIDWEDLKRVLDYEGIAHALFLAHHDG